ncbi:RsiV family protein [Paenibacillus sp. PSB04]|uniref:RsiV family protein n=1 Tax=Paenibacillus sp. PSB04 TaxID=2866810 RepID=UPI0021F1F704|nr:RsiV family protein [Paenibacillus sp. PSB04]UYO05858.1 RsiV family protein [Paenibacillus sp. PSB04]
MAPDGVSYYLKSDGTGSPAGMISLEVITEGSTGGTDMPRIDTYNVSNSAAASRVTLSGLLGEGYKDRLDADILAHMKKEPEKYFLKDYKGTLQEQTFYIENGELVIVFPKYSIAPGYVGSPEFRFNLKG